MPSVQHASKCLCLYPLAVDGGYSQWSNFTECSVTCGGGEQRRTRNCTNPLPCCGGRNCERLGPSVETRKCGTCKCGIEIKLLYIEVNLMALPGNRVLKQPRRQPKKNVTKKTSPLLNFFAIIPIHSASNIPELSGSWICKNGVQFREKNKNSPSCVHVLLKTFNLSISRCSCAQNGKEMYREV